ncbi:hypothetical protein BJY52DRAFT_672728 [Lactarius psammicola]|nr:hypothetical protein BJY52DRAFT_672728 [Lactarius psammicola]
MRTMPVMQPEAPQLLMSFDDKSADSTPTSSKAESTQAQETTPEEVMADSEPNKDPPPASTASAAPADATPAPPVPGKDLAPEKDATVTKEHAPTAESAASAFAKPNGGLGVLNVPDADAKKASETPAQTESSLPTKRNGERLDGAATVPALQPCQNGEAGGEKPTTGKSDDAKLEGPVKSALRLDHIHEVSTTFAIPTSSPRIPVDEASSSSLEREDGGEASGAKLSRNQKKRLRARAKKEKARKQVQKHEKNSPRPPSGATSNGVDNSVVQEPTPIATAPVDDPVWEGEGVLVDVGVESGEDDALVVVEKLDAAATPGPVETAATGSADDTADDDEWGW